MASAGNINFELHYGMTNLADINFELRCHMTVCQILITNLIANKTDRRKSKFRKTLLDIKLKLSNIFLQNRNAGRYKSLLLHKLCV